MLLKIFEPHRRENRPHLLVGDFNSNSPMQKIDLERTKQQHARKPPRTAAKSPEGSCRRSLMPDISIPCMPSIPTSRRTMARFPRSFPGSAWITYLPSDSGFRR